MNPGGRAMDPQVDKNVSELQPDAGILWWLEWVKEKYGEWTVPGSARD